MCRRCLEGVWIGVKRGVIDSLMRSMLFILCQLKASDASKSSASLPELCRSGWVRRGTRLIDIEEVTLPAADRRRSLDGAYCIAVYGEKLKRLRYQPSMLLCTVEKWDEIAQGSRRRRPSALSVWTLLKSTPSFLHHQ